ELAQKMKNDIHNKWGAAGTESFDELVNLVTPQNAAQVIKAYDDLKTGETLIKGISREVNSKKDVRKNNIMHIYDMLAKQKGVTDSKRAEFEQELNKEFNSWGLVDTKKLDEIINSITGTQANPQVSQVGEVQNNDAPMPIKDLEGGNYKVKLGNGKVLTANALRKDAITSARKDEGFKDVKNPVINRPLPNVNSAGKIEAASEVRLPTNKNGSMKGKVVIVNAGHGGYSPKNGFFDSGTVLSVKDANGQKKPIEEWRVAGSYTEELTKKLQAKGATVVVVSGPVRSGGMAEDKYLENMLAGKRGTDDVRKLFQNTKKANIAFVSIHVESVKNDPNRKACTVRANNDDGDQALAQKIQQHVGKNIYCLRPEVATNDYYVTRAMGTQIPAVLLELGNIANDKIAASLLSSNDRGKYTQAVADALEETLLKK
ncbi:MAG: N-acetylmuramoyl-L-alanine amidase, partial [Candidatus Gastranaerophilales bacterium]|nr:N-acetylmuramoyl-L-alanine amidase [Candidatus Gastranaerophilales bacterium]